ncbi:hypothetical protein [Sphingomonas sp. QA11]|uniref:hypothetical protein n=1 Tax=Sphingomonas sp. QA11 TaxID=2950605 RepID=UPI00300E0FE3
MADLAGLALAAGAGLLAGAMNALAGGGTFATMPTLIALGLPSPSPTRPATSRSSLAWVPVPGLIATIWRRWRVSPCRCS